MNTFNYTKDNIEKEIMRLQLEEDRVARKLHICYQKEGLEVSHFDKRSQMGYLERRLDYIQDSIDHFRRSLRWYRSINN